MESLLIIVQRCAKFPPEVTQHALHIKMYFHHASHQLLRWLIILDETILEGKLHRVCVCIYIYIYIFYENNILVFIFWVTINFVPIF